MNKRISNWIAIRIILLASLSLAVTGIWIGYDNIDAGLQRTHQEGYQLGYQVGYDRGYQEGWDSSYYQTYPEAWKLGYNRGKLDGKAPYKASSNNTISVDDALALLAEGKYNHLYWADHPELQDKNTGDTDFNLKWVRHYTDLEDLLKSLAKKEE